MVRSLDASLDCDSQPATDPVDRVRQVDETLLQIEEMETAEATSDYLQAMSVAERQPDELHDLANALSEKLIGKEDALAVVRRAADAFMSLFLVLEDDDNLSVENPRLLSDRVFGLCNEVHRLRPAIARLFDLSDATVGLLL